METIAGFTVTGPSALLAVPSGMPHILQGQAGSCHGRPGLALMSHVILLARLAATVTVDRLAFAYLAMSRFHLSVPVVLLSHMAQPFGLVSPIVALAGDTAACILHSLLQFWLTCAIARGCGLRSSPSMGLSVPFLRWKV